MNLKLRFRPFQESDLGRCVALYSETFARPPWSEIWDRRVVLARLEQILRTPHFFGLVAEEVRNSPEAQTLETGNSGSGLEDHAQEDADEVFLRPADSPPRLLAFALGYAEPSHQGRHFYLKEMCVDPDHQRQGIGSRLMDSLLAVLRDRGDQRIYLLTSRGDLSESFYTKAGFYTSRKMILMAKVLAE